MANFFTSDQHFFHKNIIILCDRPFRDLNHMHAELIKRHNDVVNEQDNVYHLGDFSFGSIEKSKAILNQLKGKHYLVRGNHDKTSFNMKKIGFEEKIAGVTWHFNENIFFDMSHFPRSFLNCELENKGNNAKDLPENNNMFSPDGENWLLHGHIHKAWKIWPQKKMINVGVDMWDFTPIHDKFLLTIIKN